MSPFRSLAFVFVLVLAVPTYGQDDYVQSTGEVCSMEGTATKLAHQELNRLKNRYVAPKPSQIDSDVTLEAMLAPGDDFERFDQTRGARITGFVVDVKTGGKETCNCAAAASIDKDTHIEIALSPDATKIQRVVVEVTPRMRAKMGDGWTTSSLKAAMKGQWVTVTGWLFFDSMHIKQSENTNPGESQNWRATAWEIHPITSITISNEPHPFPEHFHLDAFALRQSAVAVDSLKNLPIKDYRARNAKVLADLFGDDFDEMPEEDEEDEPIVPVRGPYLAFAGCSPMCGYQCPGKLRATCKRNRSFRCRRCR